MVDFLNQLADSVGKQVRIKLKDGRALTVIPDSYREDLDFEKFEVKIVSGDWPDPFASFANDDIAAVDVE